MHPFDWIPVIIFSTLLSFSLFLINFGIGFTFNLFFCHYLRFRFLCVRVSQMLGFRWLMLTYYIRLTLPLCFAPFQFTFFDAFSLILLVFLSWQQSSGSVDSADCSHDILLWYFSFPHFFHCCSFRPQFSIFHEYWKLWP